MSYQEIFLKAQACTPSSVETGTLVSVGGSAGVYGDGWGCYTTQTNLGGSTTTAWCSFPSVNIPINAVINKAYITYTATASVAGGDIVMHIYGNADTGSIDCANITTRTRTTEFQTWNVEDFANGNDYDTPLVGCVIQEIVDSGYWTSGGTLSFLLDHYSSTGSYRAMDITPTLHVWYDQPPVGYGYGYECANEGVYNCDGTPCGCEAPDCTSPGTESGTLVTKQITSQADNGFYVCGSANTTLYLQLGDYVVIVGFPSSFSEETDILSAQALAGDPTNLFLKFRELDIPSPSTGIDIVINKAFIRFTAESDNSGANDGTVECSIAMECGNTSDLSVYLNGTHPSELNRTATTVTWTEDTVGGWTKDETYDTPDLACMVQERIAQDSWSSGNDVTFLLLTNSTNTDAYARRWPYSFDDGAELAPQLNIYWEQVHVGIGGAVVGGATASPQVHTETGSGGVVCAGVAQMATRFASGGAVCSGTARLNAQSSQSLGFLTSTIDEDVSAATPNTGTDIHLNLNDGALADDPDYLTTGDTSYVNFASGTNWSNYADFTFNTLEMIDGDELVSIRYHLLGEREGAGSSNGGIPVIQLKIASDTIAVFAGDTGSASKAYETETTTAFGSSFDLYSLGYDVEDFKDSAYLRLSSYQGFEPNAGTYILYNMYLEFVTATAASGGIAAGGVSSVDGGALLADADGGAVVGGDVLSFSVRNETASGGVLGGSTSEIQVIYSVESVDGILAAGVAEEDSTAANVGTGGIVADGLSLENTNTSDIASGGVLGSDSVSEVSITYSITASAGVEIAGLSENQVTIYGTGGIEASGESVNGLVYENIANSGAVIAGDVSTTSFISSIELTGGAVLGGLVVISDSVYDEIGSGGILASGDHTIDLTYDISVGGGVSVDGFITKQFTFNLDSEISTIVSGNSAPNVIYTFTSLSGAEVSGFSLSAVFIYGKGGAELGGTADLSVIYPITWIGGGAVSGEARHIWYPIPVPTSGGVTVNSTAPAFIARKIIGGVTLGGSAAAVFFDVVILPEDTPGFKCDGGTRYTQGLRVRPECRNIDRIMPQTVESFATSQPYKRSEATPIRRTRKSAILPSITVCNQKIYDKRRFCERD